MQNVFEAVVYNLVNPIILLLILLPLTLVPLIILLPRSQYHFSLSQVTGKIGHHPANGAAARTS